MLRCESVKCGAMPYGPAAGQRMLEVRLVDDPGSDQGWNREDPREVPCYGTFRDILERDGLEGAYTKVIDGSQATFLLFVGGDIERIESAEEFDAFVTAITRDNIDFGREILKLNPAAVLKGEIKPPFMVFIGEPRTFTATRDWYQNFNVVLAKVDFRTEHQISQVALQEMLNHQNGQVLALVDDPSQLERFYTPMNHIRKTTVIDFTRNGREVFDKCLSVNWRYYHHDPVRWNDLEEIG